MALGPRNRYVHSAYQVSDMDAMAAGGEYLREHGYRRSWGIGRHIQGSQIFDYWRDPDGFLVEHFADGDMFDSSLEPGWAAFTATGLAQWGPPVTKDFLGISPGRDAIEELRSTVSAVRKRQRIRPQPPPRPDESSHLMTTSVLRTADAWWVQTATGADESTPLRPPPASCCATGPPIEPRNASPTLSPSNLAPGLPGDHPVPGGSPDDELRVARQGCRHESGDGPIDVLPQGIRIDQWTDRRHRQARARPILDYEVEIGLVIGRELPVGTTITESDLPDYVAGLVVTNDVSARDVQLPKTQFYESKSYPTFTPVGPALVLLDADELKRFGDLRLRLRVNGELRQDMVVAATCSTRPLRALQELTRFQRLDVGDLVLTGPRWARH